MRHLIAQDSLGTLTKIGQGGQGVVYGAPKARTKFADSMVFKEYRPQIRAKVNFEALAAMSMLPERTLSYQDGQRLISIASWPCALVEDSGGPVGFIMPAIPDSFSIDLTTVKGVSRATAEFQHLLNPPAVLAARGITLTDHQRYQLLREVAKALSFLHRIGVCVGDISPKNLLYSTEPNPAVYFIDADAMAVNGKSTLPQVETPGWEVPTGQDPATIYSDTYKLGLLALRLLAGDQHTRNPEHLPSTTPKLLRQLITDALINIPDRRPLPEAWTYLLGQVTDQFDQDRRAPRIPSQPRHAASTDSPEPPPVVRSRTTKPPPQGGKPTTAQASPAIAAPATAITFPRLPRLPVRAAILIAALIGVIGLLVFIAVNHPFRTPPPKATFNGTFTATYDHQTDFNGNNATADDGSPSQLTWVVRSSCNGDQCVATARTKNRAGGDIDAIFDYIDGRWLAVYTRNDMDCGGNELWVAFSLVKTNYGDSLAGDMYWAHSDGNECSGKGAVTFTRTGDPDASVQTPDPAGLEARKISPALSLHGSYHEAMAYLSGTKYETDYKAATFCLRSAARCLTYFNTSANSREAFIFAGNEWTRTTTRDTTCTDGTPSKTEFFTTMPLPQNTPSPIIALNGTGVAKTVTGCPGTQPFEVTLSRTGG